jgi:hypothetical protein
MKIKIAARLSVIAAIVLASPAFADEPLPQINLPIEGWSVVAQRKGWLQEAYAKLGTKVVDPGTQKLIGAEAANLDRGGLADVRDTSERICAAEAYREPGSNPAATHRALRRIAQR